jgi:hypothetical protein
MKLSFNREEEKATLKGCAYEAIVHQGRRGG